MNRRPVVLLIAGSDSSGGAGITRDIQVLTDFEIDARCAITAVTAQSDSQVFSVHPVPIGQVRAQIDAAFATGPLAAIKIGMLYNRAIVGVVAQTLTAWPRVPVVLDPVLVSSSGGILLDAEGRDVMQRDLFPFATVLTPNLPEAAMLLCEPQAIDDPMLERQARELCAMGCGAVLLKGGHADRDESADLLLTDAGTIHRLSAPRVDATCRGTGCALASAICAGLARGIPMREACEQAKQYVHAMFVRSASRYSRADARGK